MLAPKVLPEPRSDWICVSNRNLRGYHKSIHKYIFKHVLIAKLQNEKGWDWSELGWSAQSHKRTKYPICRKSWSSFIRSFKYIFYEFKAFAATYRRFPLAGSLPHTPVGWLKQNIFAGARDLWKNPWLGKNVKYQIKLKCCVWTVLELNVG